MNPKPELTVALERLNEARTVFDDCTLEYEAASSRRTDALNALNAAQRAFDETVANLKAGSPRDTDWSRAARCGIPV